MQKYVIINVAGNGIRNVMIVDSIGLNFFCLIDNLDGWGGDVLKAGKHKMRISAITIVNIIILATGLINTQIIII